MANAKQILLRAPEGKVWKRAHLELIGQISGKWMSLGGQGVERAQKGARMEILLYEATEVEGSVSRKAAASFSFEAVEDDPRRELLLEMQCLDEAHLRWWQHEVAAGLRRLGWTVDGTGPPVHRHFDNQKYEAFAVLLFAIVVFGFILWGPSPF